MTIRTAPRTLAPIPYSRYKSEVRKFDRDSVLALCGRKSAELDSSGLPASAGLPYTEWALLDIARVAVVFGRPGGRQATMEDIAQLCRMHLNVLDPSLTGDSAGATGAILRLTAEQYSWQTDVLSNFARTLLLFSPEAPWPDGKTPQVMTGTWFEACFGVDLETYVAAVFISYAAVSANDGRFDLAWISREPIKGIFADFATEDLVSAIKSNLCADTSSLKLRNREAESRAGASMLKHAFNPLILSPLISNATQIALAPSVRAVINKVSPNAVFYTAAPILGDDFAADLGHVFEAYIGRQLQSLPDCAVHAEVRYKVGPDYIDSIDWFVQFDNLVVLVECKAVRPTEPVRLGRPEYAQHLQRQIGKGITQLNRTNNHFDVIAETNRALDSTLPRIALVVTAEDHHGIGLPTVRQTLPNADIPTAAISARELEQLVALSSARLKQELDDARVGCSPDNVLQINAHVPDTGMPDNAILMQAFDSFTVMRAIEAAHNSN